MHDLKQTPVFRVSRLTKVYRMGEVEVHALRGVDLELDVGQFLVLLGHSGSGKSTLLNIIGGLDIPTAGSVFYREQDLTAADESTLTTYRRRSVGFVFQFYNLVPSLTGRENVALVTEISDDPMAPEEALEIVGLRGSDGSLSVADVGRRATTCRDRSRHRQTSRRLVCATSPQGRLTSRPA